MLFRVEGMIGSKTYRCVEGRPAIHMANRDIIKLAKSVNKWAASVAIAKLLDQIPPEKSCTNDCSKRVVIVFMGMYKASPNAQHPSKFGGLSMLQLEFKRLQGNKLRTRSQRKSTHTTTTLKRRSCRFVYEANKMYTNNLFTFHMQDKPAREENDIS